MKKILYQKPHDSASHEGKQYNNQQHSPITIDSVQDGVWHLPRGIIHNEERDTRACNGIHVRIKCSEFFHQAMALHRETKISVFINSFGEFSNGFFESIHSITICLLQYFRPSMAVCTITTTLFDQIIQQPWKYTSRFIASTIGVRW
jgi:hypothetical protein